MSNSTTLNGILDDDYKSFINLSTTFEEFFTFFASQQILKRFDLSVEDLFDGVCKPVNEDFSFAFYLFFNGELIREDTEIDNSTKNPNLELVIVLTQNNNNTNINNDIVFNSLNYYFNNTSSLYFNTQFIRDLDEHKSRFKKFFNHIKNKPHFLIVKFYHVVRCEEIELINKIDQPLNALIHKALPHSNLSIINISDNELYAIFATPPDNFKRLKFSQQLGGTNGGYVAFVNIKDFYSFIIDKDSNLARSLFESNIRDYQGSVAVNKGIKKTLSEKFDPEHFDFWWFNNGITITSKDVVIRDSFFEITAPQIVNGLQTSYEIFRFFSSENDFDEKRNILIRLLKTDDDVVQSQIINATNSQTSMPISALWASDSIQRDLELYFKTKGWFYDRRKGYYMNEKQSKEKIVSISYLTQCVLSLILRRPNDARARPTSFFRSSDNDKMIESYHRVFNKDFPLDVYLFSVKLMRKVENALMKNNYSKTEVNNIKFYVGLFLLYQATDNLDYKNEDLLALKIEDIFDSEILDSSKTVIQLFKELGGDDKVSKGTEFLKELNQLASGFVSTTGGNFLERIIERDIKEDPTIPILTRFPPEPNGYLHIGHSKSICLNFDLAAKFGGKTNLRYDDTNPSTEETEYVESILEDIRWLGFEPANIFYASNYFDQLYEFAKQLIAAGKAYVDFSSPEEVATMKGTPTEAGKASPYRDTTVEENLAQFERMKNGEYPDGHCTLRAKIDMAAPNMHLRDPYLYRIKHAHHHRTGDKWCIYPMYDWAHGQSDSIEQITHSICTLEFIPHRDLYNWCIEQLGIFPSKQYEFARLNLTYTVMSKRKLLQLVKENYVSGWDDPRMPTISGLRRRGFTADSIRDFARRIGVAKRENLIELSLLEFCVREDLNKKALRRFAVLNPIKVVLTNFPEGQTEWLETENNPEDPEGGKRPLAFTRHLWIEQDDFMENPPPKYFRLSPGGMVRLKSAFIIKCEDLVKNEAGEVVEIHCSYVPESRSGSDTSGLKVQGVIHWLAEGHTETAEVRMYDRLFQVEDPAAEEDFKLAINPNSLEIIHHALIEPALHTAQAGAHFQFTRLGYFCADPDSTDQKKVFNRTVTLKDSWAKGQKK